VTDDDESGACRQDQANDEAEQDRPLGAATFAADGPRDDRP
jgi:hypothetical protein